MSTPTRQSPEGGTRRRTRSCATGLVCHRCEQRFPLEQSVFACPQCGKGLDISYDYERAAQHFEQVPRTERPTNIWHFEELLPITDASAQARVGRYAGYTPLIRADRLAAELRLSHPYLKDGSACRPNPSSNNRVVASAVAPLLEVEKEEVRSARTRHGGDA